MKIAVVGGGPGGLYFGRLLKRRLPRWEVTVFERNPADATYGFGVVFWGRTLQTLEEADPEVYASILEESLSWEGMQLRHKGTTLGWPGFGFTGISRKRLLRVLQGYAGSAGVDLRFGHEAHPRALEGFDLVIAADGVNSYVRRHRSERFGTTEDVGRAKFIWLGTRAPIDKISFSFKQTEAGPFAVHAYPFEEGTCTFLVETDEGTWRRAGLDAPGAEVEEPGASDLKAIAFLEEVFEEDLRGHGLLGNNSKWLNFRTIRNSRWHDDGYVLLGDAAHTGHPSVASGTKMAMEDAIELASVLEEAGDAARVGEALVEYERRRKPAVERTQLRSDLSRAWWETFGRRMRMEPEQLSFSYLTRSGAVSYDQMENQGPDFVTSVVRRFAAANGEEGRPDRPLHTPLKIGGLTLANRVVSVRKGGPSTGANGHGRVEPPGLLVVDGAYARGARENEEGRRPLLCLRTSAEALRSAQGPDVSGNGSGLGAPSKATDLLRSREGVALVLVALPQMNSAEADDTEAVLELAGELRAAGCDLVLVPSPLGPGDGTADEAATARSWDAQLSLSERIRLETGLGTVVECDPDRTADADTAVLSGRTDLVCFGS